ncbi:MAG: hypothetical protein AAGJ17_00135 [Pseudomonadota bacterium]
MSDSNIVTGIKWDQFAPGTPTEFKNNYTGLTTKVDFQVSEINKNSNGLKDLNESFDKQKLKVDDELENQNRNIEQQNQQIKGISQQQANFSKSINELNGKVEKVETDVKTLQDEVENTVKKDQFATLTDAGIVLLSEKVNQLTAIELTSSPEMYDHENDQANRTAIQNAINDIITSFNDLIVKQQAAKQMEQ